MPSGPPPSRYRVIERGGRLQVIDTWAATRPQPRTADYAEPESIADVDLSDQALADTMTDAWPRPARSSPDPVGTPSPAPAASDQPAFSAPSPLRASPIVAGPPELLRNVAATICGDKRDGDGRLLLKTARFYDSRAPRMIALDPDGEREVGLVVLVAVAAAAGAVLFTATLGWPGIVVGVIAVGLVGRANVIGTPWLDRLAARTR
jgi:preprotein translocase subunit Sec61beta